MSSVLAGRAAGITGARRAILCVLGAGVLFAMAAALIKSIGAGRIPTFEMVVFRSVMISGTMFVLLGRRGEGIGALRTKRPFGHLSRTLLGFVAMSTSYLGYVRLPLAVLTALGFAMPLFLTLLAVPLLGERVGWRRMLAVAVGLGGVLIIVRPWNGSREGVPLDAVALVLAGVVAWAVSMVSIRQMGAAGERNVTIVLWYSLGSLVLSTLLAVPQWVTPTAIEAAVMIAAGLITAGAQLLMTDAYRGAEATLVAPFEYGAIVPNTLLGLVFWNEWPDAWTLLGIAVLIAAGLEVWRREAAAARRSA